MFLLLACDGGETGDPVEPIVVPDDPAAEAAPVGVRTVEAEGQVMEVWYPAPESSRGSPTEDMDFLQFIPSSVLDALGTIDVPPIDTTAVRDAPLRETGEPWPVIVFSHGFGAMRLQSPDITTHWASRGYVVVAADHPGRMLTDLLPCMFSPPLDGCDLSGMGGADPAVEDVSAVADWLEAANTSGEFAGRLDLTTIGLAGHSAGGATVDAAADADPRFGVLLAMAAGAAPASEAPLLLMSGTCDGIVPDSASVAAKEARPASTLVQLGGAGHLAFSDLCELDLKTLGKTLFGGRDDVNDVFLEQLYVLASDGCPSGEPVIEACVEDGFLDLEVSAPIVRGYSAAWFDAGLRGTGGVEAGWYPEAVFTGPE